MTKYKKHFQTMLEENQELFNQFKKIEDEYRTSPESVTDSFNDEGNKVLKVIRRYEDELCAKSEGGKFGKFSQNLSEKFWIEVRDYFPHIDSIRLE